MFQEYKWIPGLSNRIYWQGAMLLGAYWIAAAGLYSWMRFGEPIYFHFQAPRIYLFTFFLIAGGLFNAFGVYSMAKQFRMISTDQGLEIGRGSRETKINYSDITKIQLWKRTHLLIYTSASTSIPSLVVSDEISNRSQLDDILRQFVSFEPTEKLPRAMDMRYRSLGTIWFLLPLSLNLVSTNPTMRIVSGILFLAFVTYALSLSWIFRSQIKSPLYLISMIFLAIIVIYRTAIVFLYNH